MIITNNNPPRAMKRYLADWIFPNLTIDTFDTRKRNKVYFIDVEEGIVCFRELSRISHIFGLTYCGSGTGFPWPRLGRVTSKIIPVIKLTSWRPGDEGAAFTGFMGTCILLV